MSRAATVLFDAPGPRGRRNNRIYTALTLLVSGLVLWWVVATLAENGQLTADKWSPFVDPRTWQTYLLPGLWGTLRSAFLSILLALLMGVLLGLGRLAQTAWIRWICAAVVEFFRAIPVLLLMIFAYQLFAVYAILPPRQLAFGAVVFGLTMYNGSVIAEILRSGIRSLPKGQVEAAQTLGLSHRQTLWSVQLPQAVTAMLPALIAQMVIALKDSALGYQIGYVEVVRSGIQSASSNQNYLAALAVVAVAMILINYVLSGIAQLVERRMYASRSQRGQTAEADADAEPRPTPAPGATIGQQTPGTTNSNTAGR